MESAGSSNEDGVEGCGFQEDVLRCAGDGGRGAAFDSGQCDGFLGIGDDQFASSQRDGFRAVAQWEEGFPFVGHADDDRAAGKRVQIERVCRLSVFKEHEVACIDDAVSWDITSGGESLGDELR